jgi:16S rRNA (guanine527-N7)-methyltransferase
MENFKQEIQTLLGIHLSVQQTNQFKIYEQELLTWNDRFNLTAIRDVVGIRNKHFIDSLSCTMAFNETAPVRLIDIGTGAGFPGIPLKILYPGLILTLVDSVGKKVEFCRHVVETLKLERVEVIQGRAEELGQSPKFREKYDWAVARAVANLPTLIEFLLPLVRVGGGALAQKGESGLAEAHASEKVVQIMGGRLRQLRKVNIPGVVEDRYLIIIDKVAPTPAQYPRRVGLPSKKPLG